MKPNGFYRLRHVAVLTVLLSTVIPSGLFAPQNLSAKDYVFGVDESTTSWSLPSQSRSGVRVISHRHSRVSTTGTQSEHVIVETQQTSTYVRLERAIPGSRVIDDLAVSVAVAANRDGVVVAMRVILPHQKDPRTGAVLSAWLRGDEYRSTPKWQVLRCEATTEKVRERLQYLRAELKTSDIDVRDAYVDRVALSTQLFAGTTEFFIDETRLTGSIPVQDEVPRTELVAGEESAGPNVEFRLDRLFVDGFPMFPRTAAYHGEDPRVLQQSGLNLILVPDYRDAELMRQLTAHKLRILATPPRALSEAGEILNDKTASLVPFADESAPVLAWYLGTRIPWEARSDLIAWSEQIRSADRRFQRPLMADVDGAERTYSRHVGLLGVSRHAVNSSLSFLEYRDWLDQRHRLARPGSFAWTWVQTEPVAANMIWRQAAAKTPIVVEPEQIRLQVYSALAAGCRGIGFWSTGPLDGDAPGDLERRLAVSQLNLELELLEPWLATSTVTEHRPILTDVQVAQAEASMTTNIFEFGHAPSGARTVAATSHDESPVLYDAAVLETDHGLLLLPVWYPPEAQFVPGRMVARNVSLVVPGVPKTAFVWEVTTTGLQSLEGRRVAGGLMVTIPRFDQTAAIVIASDQHWKTKLMQKIRDLQARSARIWIDLATAKLDRVRQVDEQLRTLGVPHADALFLLQQAEQAIQQAEISFKQSRPTGPESSSEFVHLSRDLDLARQWSCAAMETLRVLQKAHWDHAVARFASPMSSLHAVCFQTLPDHWKMIEHLGQSRADLQQNRLPSGSFDSIDSQTLFDQGWRHVQNESDGVRATAELALASGPGNYCLRLVAIPATNEDPPKVVERTPVSVSSAPIAVAKDEIVYVSGRVRVVTPLAGSIDGATLAENLSGSAGALKWNRPADWQHFELIREVHEDTDFTLTMSLHGMGEVQFDDLQVVTHRPAPVRLTGGLRSPDEHAKDSSSRALELLQRFSKFGAPQAK